MDNSNYMCVPTARTGQNNFQRIDGIGAYTALISPWSAVSDILDSQLILCLIQLNCIFTSSPSGVWSCPATTGEKPPPCAGFTFTAIDDRRAVLFGGVNGEHGKMKDVYIIDLQLMVLVTT